MKKLTVQAPRSFAIAAVLVVAWALLFPVGSALASTETTPTESTMGVPDPALMTNTPAEATTIPGVGTSRPDVLPEMDSKGVPYLETAQNAANVSWKLAIQLAAAGELRTAFIDDAKSLMVLVTNGGVVLSVLYDEEPELLQALFDAKVVPTFVTYAPAPVQEVERIERNKSKFDWMKLGLALPIIIMIGGTAIIYEIGQRKRRKERGAPVDGTTAFQTREGPGGAIPTVTFEDVAGCEEAIEDLSEVVEFLKDPERFERLGAKIPRGAILVGPPGTGKTLLARAVAGEAKVPFFAASGSDFVEMYVGVGSMRVRELFAKARAEEKAIVFIDEIDAVARARVMSTKQNANDERENTLNALLNELDGFSRSNVILLAATNRVDILDPAILRPGRLDRKIQVPNPDRRGRERILEVHVDGKPLAKDVDLGHVAKRTPGMSGADLAQIANEAAIEAARRNLKNIDASCFSSAVALVAMGRARRSALVTDRDRLITAYHEAGHTICALLHPDAADPVSVSITPRGHAGGITWMNGTDDQYLARPQAAAQLVVAMGGRVGEELLLDGEFTQGPSSDLEKATQLATVMVTRYGMTRRGLAVRTGEPDVASHDVIEELLSGALRDARTLIETNMGLFTAIVNQLLEHETLEHGDLADIVESLSADEIGEGFAGARSMKALQQAGHAALAVAANAGSLVVKAGRRSAPKKSKNDAAKNDAAKNDAAKNDRAGVGEVDLTAGSSEVKAPSDASTNSQTKVRARTGSKASSAEASKSTGTKFSPTGKKVSRSSKSVTPSGGKRPSDRRKTVKEPQVD